MMGLVLRRMRIQKKQLWWKEKKDGLLPTVFAYLDGIPFETALGRSIQKSDLRPLQEIALDLIASVRGETKERLITLLVDIGGVVTNAERLKTGKEWERQQAVRNLSIYPKEQAENLLRAVLEDPSQNLRIAAARALIDIGAEITLDELIKSLFSKGGEKSIALRDIFRRIAPQQADALLNILSQEISESLQLLVIDALGTTRNHESIPTLMQQFDSPLVDVRAEVLRALTTIGHPDATSIILQGLDDEKWEVRAQAAVGAGRIGIDSAIPKLRELMDDDEWWARFRAAEALKKIGGKGISMLSKTANGTSRAAKIAELVLNQEAA